MTDAGDLCGPSQQQSGADVVALSSDEVEHTSVLHQLGDDHQLLGHADGRYAHAARVIHRRHDASLLQQVGVLRGRGALAKHLHRHAQFHVLGRRQPHSLLYTKHELSATAGWIKVGAIDAATLGPFKT